jgi:molybdate transport system substrate-binding protein
MFIFAGASGMLTAFHASSTGGAALEACNKDNLTISNRSRCKIDNPPMNLLKTFAATVLVLFTTAATADDIRVFAAGAAKHAVDALAPAFQQATGHTLRASYDTVGALTARVKQAAPGQAADIVILSDSALASLGAAGRLSSVPAYSVGRVVVAVAVKLGTPLPDLSTRAALQAALLAADSIAYGDPARGATAGTHFAKVIAAMNLEIDLKNKMTVLPFGVDVITGVAQGNYAFGISQSSEIRQHPGVSYAGPLPAPYGLSTGYSAALSSDSPAALQLLTFIKSQQAANEFEASGFTQKRD